MCSCTENFTLEGALRSPNGQCKHLKQLTASLLGEFLFIDVFHVEEIKKRQSLKGKIDRLFKSRTKDDAKSDIKDHDFCGSILRPNSTKSFSFHYHKISWKLNRNIQELRRVKEKH